MPYARGQDIIPGLTVMEAGGKNILSWVNEFRTVRSIGVQWSMDSQYNYSTIGYARQPGLRQNTFTDQEIRMGINFYRLYFELTDGKVDYSSPVRILDSLQAERSHFQIPPPMVILPEPVIKKEVMKKILPVPYSPSIYVYTNQDGNVNISLEDVLQGQYTLKFYDSTGALIFTIPRIDQDFLILDKSNFLHSGWFHFKLFNHDKLKQKWKLFIPDQSIRLHH
ncbi:MAG TPA: hypothetical protein VNE41_10000 [Chitinophagaceae bacterium]|nr:hypothetical protein [Chitinophagaceae bacterium]